MGKIIDDGLNKWQRYRLKDIDAYRKKKRDYARTPEQRKIRRVYQQKWREKNREYYNKWTREHHQKNRDKYNAYQKAQRYVRLYGITIDERERMIHEQKCCCKICGKKFKSQKHAHVDHSHVTGRVRGILCSKCNGNLGWYERYSLPIVAYLS